MVKLGQKVRDRITGFEGTVTGRAEYITGCAQILVVPAMKNDTFQEARWFDEQRLDILDARQLVLDNGTTPGCDIPAPIR